MHRRLDGLQSRSRVAFNERLGRAQKVPFLTRLDRRSTENARLCQSLFANPQASSQAQLPCTLLLNLNEMPADTHLIAKTQVDRVCLDEKQG